VQILRCFGAESESVLRFSRSDCAGAECRGMGAEMQRCRGAESVLRFNRNDCAGAEEWVQRCIGAEAEVLSRF
jgi:hypothetical protein